MPKAIEKLTIEELDAEIDRLNRERDLLKQQIRGLNEARNEKLNAQSARDKLARMSAGERAALAQIVQAEGVKSEESFGTI